MVKLSALHPGIVSDMVLTGVMTGGLRNKDWHGFYDERVCMPETKQICFVHPNQPGLERPYWHASGMQGRTLAMPSYKYVN